ncbi:Ubiquitin-like-specific protease 2 [Pseudocercospora fuligena]|uniref:Ubiquitin-like-specific protease 2 n=1 Tax=Pseudocercospora fuligena TaxID=685502 RepID=A0A8H6RIL2_9PEZI|nr:Ubiquitin-like-specific protease 2 [Pseudocercospora fuligena]
MACFYTDYWRKRERIQWRGYFAYLTSQNTTTTTNAARSPSVEEVTSARGSPARKRVRVSDGERHYFSDYTVPANGATAFAPVPATREENAAELEARRRAGNMGAPYKPKGSVKPGNTLGNGAKQAPATTKGAFFSDYKRDRPPMQQLPTAPSRGGNVGTTKRKGFADDGDDQMMQPNAKRRQQANGVTSSPIDLTDGEDFSAGKVVRVVSQKPVKAPSGSQGSRHAVQPRQQKLSSQMDTFGNNQMQNVDAMLWKGRTSQRIARNELNHVQAGPRAGDDLRQGQHGTRELPEEIQDDSQPTTNDHRKAKSAIQSRTAQSRAMLPIDLDSGVFDDNVRQYQEKQRENAQGGTRDMDDVTSVFQNKNHRAARSPTKGSTIRRTIPQQLTDEAFQTHANGTVERRPAASAKLADQFQRDTEDRVDITEAPTKTKAAERMQIQARPGSSGEGSMDELQGERTVLPRSSRSISPQKPFKQPTMTNGTSLKRKAAPAATQPANIHAKPVKHKRGYQGPPADVAAQELDEASDYDERVSITDIFCKACALSDTGLELAWSLSSEGYHVMREGELQKIPHQGTAICIGKGNVSTFISSKDYPVVHLKGPSGDISNGSIIIAFTDLEGKSTFYSRLLSENKVLRTDNSLEIDKLQKIFLKQVQEQRKLYNETLARPPKPQPRVAVRTSIAGRNPRVLPTRREEASDDEIKYELSSDSEERSTAVSRMQGGDTLADAMMKDNYQQPRVRGRQADQTASPYFEHNQLRRSGRDRKPVVKARSPTPVQVEKWTENNDFSSWQHEMTWPFTGKNRALVVANDLKKLDDEEMLNDNIINFGLRYTEEFIRPEFKDKVYWFNTYLYETLTKGPRGKGINYAGVERWTKNVDLFTKPYIVVPINLNLHWFVAIICNLPNLQRKFADSDPADPLVPSPGPADHEADDSSRLQPPDQEMTELALSDADVDSKPVSDDEKDAKDGIFQFGDDGKVIGADVEDQATGASKGRGRKKKKAPPGPRKVDPTTPIILTFDSFGFGRSKEIKVLKDYLVMEAKTKRKMELSVSQIPQMTAKGIPGQKNFSDCGVYLLGYIEKFAQNPDDFVRKLLQFEMREEDFEFDPSQKRVDIRDKLLELSRENEANIRKAKKVKQDAKKRANGASAQKQCVADGSSPARQKTPTPAPTPSNEAALSRQQTPARPVERVEVQASSHGQKRHGAIDAAIDAYPTSQTLGDEDQELPVSPPRVAGGRNVEQFNATDTRTCAEDEASSDDSEEMLDSGDVIHVSNQQQTSLAPQPKSPAERESRSPLGTVQAIAEAPVVIDDSLQDVEPEDNALSPENISGVRQQHADDGPDVIDIGDEDDDRPADSPEIPDSQPTQGTQGKAIPVRTSSGKEYTLLD